MKIPESWYENSDEEKYTPEKTYRKFVPDFIKRRVLNLYKKKCSILVIHTITGLSVTKIQLILRENKKISKDKVGLVLS